tara:strand:+ start:27 stop:392 length:366 start_codon:yes stop_codon:yes gene_type:complete
MAFQIDAFQNNAFQVSTQIILADTHDGKYHDKRLKKRFADDNNKARLRRAQIVQAYEHLVEGRPELIQEINEAVMGKDAKPATAQAAPAIDFDKLLANLDRAEQLWAAYIEMDDEEVLLLI